MTRGHQQTVRYPSRPVCVVTCAWCAAPLADDKGDPRWHITTDLDFVCLDGCRTVPTDTRRRGGSTWN